MWCSGATEQSVKTLLTATVFRNCSWSCVGQHTAHCTLHTAHSTQHIAHCTLHTAHSTLHTVHSTLHTAHSTQHTAHSTQHTAHCTQYTAHIYRCVFVCHHITCGLPPVIQRNALSAVNRGFLAYFSHTLFSIYIYIYIYIKHTNATLRLVLNEPRGPLVGCSGAALL